MTYKLPPLPDLGPEWTAYWTKVVHEKMQAYAIAAIEARGVPDGWQLVPKEPTDEMVRAALHLDLSYVPGHDGPDRAAVYKAMLASAPPAPQEKPQPLSDAKTLASLLGAALGALRYHTEQTRPIARTSEVIRAIEHELSANGIKGE